MKDLSIVDRKHQLAGPGAVYIVEGFMAGDGQATEIADGYSGVLGVVAHYLGVQYTVSASPRQKYEARKLIAEAAAEKEQRLVVDETLQPNAPWKRLEDLPAWIGSLLTRPKGLDLPRLPEDGLPAGSPPMFVCRHRLPGDIYVPGGLIEIFDPLTEASLVESFVIGGFLKVKAF
ncbi:MAG: hypothetical protein JWM49_616 [Microbacteriaceae bacterium]|nr:hypothetical protein [Microbacteriaceae bacterium]